MTSRTRIALVGLAVLLAAALFAPTAQASEPARSGTVLIAHRPTNGLGPMPGCEGVSECLAWRLTCAQLPPTRVGATASIVDVRKLAGTSRVFRVVDAYVELYTTGMTVEFWTGSCRRLRLANRDLEGVSWARFTIPGSAVWMTVTSPCVWICTSYSGTMVRWELR